MAKDGDKTRVAPRFLTGELRKSDEELVWGRVKTCGLEKLPWVPAR